MHNKTFTRADSYRQAKTAPDPSFPTDEYLLPETIIVVRPELRRVTQPPHIAGPLCLSGTITGQIDP